MANAIVRISLQITCVECLSFSTPGTILQHQLSNSYRKTTSANLNIAKQTVCELEFPDGCAHTKIFTFFVRGHLGKPFGGLVWLRPAAAQCEMQLVLHVLPRALAAAGCGENAIYASAAALANVTYAVPAVQGSFYK